MTVSQQPNGVTALNKINSLLRNDDSDSQQTYEDDDSVELAVNRINTASLTPILTSPITPTLVDTKSSPAEENQNESVSPSS